MTSAFCNWIGYKLKKMKFRKIIYLTQQIWLMDHKVHIFAINSNPSPYKYTCCSGFVINIYIPHLWQAPSLLSWNDYVNWSLIDQMNRIPFFWYCFNYFFLYCCAGWGYVVAFTKVLTIYQIYHTWIHPLYHSPLYPHALIPGIVSTGIILHLHACVHIFCTIFTLLSPFSTTSTFYWYQNSPTPPGLGLPSCSPIV
jgi:hypothetical protein